jgi:oxygen-independent coproporphyrinogen III oxidase
MAGIYIHIPFCKKKCSYCDFHFSTTFSKYRAQMINAISKEIELKASYLEGKRIETIYFGGGTPSLLKKEELKQILKSVYTNFHISSFPEVTLEANPDDINETGLQMWKEIGVNRLSIGIQSFKEDDLTWMNRAHTIEEAKSCIPLAKRFGFDNLTIDLMYGLPSLSLDEWRSHIQFVLDQEVNHISAYCLTVEQRTALYKKVSNKEIVLGTEDEQSEQFMVLLNELEANGFEQYEISNFSKPGKHSIHNTNYWKGNWYLGVGPSAHSFNGTSRSWNISNNRLYMQAVESGKAMNETEVLSIKDQFNERIMTGLRTNFGIDLAQLNQIVAIDTSFRLKVKEFETENWIISLNNVIKLTKEGRLRADYIAAELFIVD